MSWLSKVSDLAGRAEDLLVRLDQNTGAVIADQKQRNSTSNLSINREQQGTFTEEVGRPEPSHAHSDFVKPKRKQPTTGYAPSTSILPEQRDANLISFLNEPEKEEREAARSTFSVHSITEAADLVRDKECHKLQSQLAVKDSQIEVLQSRIQDLEKRVEDEKKKAKKAIEDSECVQIESREGPSTQSLSKERNCLQAEVLNVKKRLVSQEEQLSAVNDQLRLAKFNLTENKREFDEYKEKAQKILQTKERLIESLKSESGGEEKSNSVLLAQIEEMKLERDMARADLESAQVQLYNVRAELDETESASRDAKVTLGDTRRRLEEERESWHVNHSILKEKADCARSELEVGQKELEKERLQWQIRLDEREAQIVSLREEAKRKRSTNGIDDGGKTTMLLLQKEEELREVLREKQILTVRLERAQRTTKDVIVPIGDGPSSITSSPSHSFFHSNLLKTLNFLRANRTARTYFIGYLMAIHLLLFFIILTYTPESHSDHYSPANPINDRG